jgi:hypothetical protein
VIPAQAHFVVLSSVFARSGELINAIIDRARRAVLIQGATSWLLRLRAQSAVNGLVPDGQPFLAASPDFGSLVLRGLILRPPSPPVAPGGGIPVAMSPVVPVLMPTGTARALVQQFQAGTADPRVRREMLVAVRSTEARLDHELYDWPATALYRLSDLDHRVLEDVRIIDGNALAQIPMPESRGSLRMILYSGLWRRGGLRLTDIVSWAVAAGAAEPVTSNYISIPPRAIRGLIGAGGTSVIGPLVNIGPIDRLENVALHEDVAAYDFDLPGDLDLPGAGGPRRDLVLTGADQFMIVPYEDCPLLRRLEPEGVLDGIPWEGPETLFERPQVVVEVGTFGPDGVVTEHPGHPAEQTPAEYRVHLPLDRNGQATVVLAAISEDAVRFGEALASLGVLVLLRDPGEAGWRGLIPTRDGGFEWARGLELLRIYRGAIEWLLRGRND